MNILFENKEEIVAGKDTPVFMNKSHSSLEEKTTGNNHENISKYQNNFPEKATLTENNRFKETLAKFELFDLQILNSLPSGLIDVFSHLDSKCMDYEQNNDHHKLQQ